MKIELTPEITVVVSDAVSDETIAALRAVAESARKNAPEKAADAVAEMIAYFRRELAPTHRMVCDASYSANLRSGLRHHDDPRIALPGS